jgi:hypothetical protein
MIRFRFTTASVLKHLQMLFSRKRLNIVLNGGNYGR